MDYFACLDISMDETHVAFSTAKHIDQFRREQAESTAQAVANELAKAPSCRRIVFETGQTEPILFHGLSQLDAVRGLRGEPAGLSGAQVHFTTHERNRNDARGPAQLARTLASSSPCM